MCTRDPSDIEDDVHVQREKKERVAKDRAAQATPVNQFLGWCTLVSARRLPVRELDGRPRHRTETLKPNRGQRPNQEHHRQNGIWVATRHPSHNGAGA